MSAYSSSEVKSGLFISVALVLLVGLTFWVGGFMSGETKNYQIQFGYIGGLTHNASVYFAGVEVGKVDAIEVIKGDERPVIVTVSVLEEIEIKVDSNAVVDVLGMMGEPIISISAGSEEAPLLQTGTVLRGEDPIPVYQMIGKMNKLADRMDEMTESLMPLIKQVTSYTTGHKEEIAKIIANIHETSANVRDLTHDLKFRPWRLVRKG